MVLSWGKTLRWIGLFDGARLLIASATVRVRYKCERSDRLNPFHMQAAICCRGEQDLRGHCRFELWSTVVARVRI